MGKKVLKQIKCIDRIIPLVGLKYVKTATKYKQQRNTKKQSITKATTQDQVKHGKGSKEQT